MAGISDQPVFLCKRCHRPVKIKVLETTKPDPDGKLLESFINNVHKIMLCPDCVASYNCYAAQGRTADWEAGRP